MRKSIHKKKPAGKKLKNNSQAVLFVRYTTISLGILIALVSLKLLSAASSTVHVLGASTGPTLLARDGEESNTNELEIHDTGTNTPPQNPDTTNYSSTSPTLTNTVNNTNSKVDCVGPDERHFVTSFHDCQELNTKWGRSNFQFTQVATPTKINDGEKHSASSTSIQPLPTGSPHLEFEQDGTKTHVNLEQPGSHIEIKKEDDGRLHIAEKKEDGTEIELDEKDALDKINEKLKDRDIEIGSGSASKFAFRSGKVETHTNFPLSVDPITGQLTVTTPSGTHAVTILPQKAVQNMLDSKVLTNVLSTGDAITASAGAANNVIALTEVDNNPAFEINGVTDKKVLGIIPVAFSKTVFVSPEDGQVIKTQQSTFDKLLELISF